MKEKLDTDNTEDTVYNPEAIRRLMPRVLLTPCLDAFV